MNRKKLFSLVCVLMLLVAFTGFAYADQEEAMAEYHDAITPNCVFGYEKVVRIYEDVDTIRAAGVYTEPELLKGNESAVLAARKAMVDRQENFDVRLKVDDIENVDINVLESTLMEAALAETGCSYEGDYLRFSIYTYSAGVRAEDGDIVFSYSMTYFSTHEQEQAVAAAIPGVISSFGFAKDTTDFDKVFAVYSYICDNVVYDYAHLNDMVYKTQQTAYGALIDHTSVCQGYAMLFNRFMLEMGIPARCMTGSSHGENHMWNIVQLDGQYYYVDSTWDAGTPSLLGMQYFLKGGSDFQEHMNDDRSNEVMTTLAMHSDDYPFTEENCSFTDGDFSYIITGWRKAAVTEYRGNDADVTVPGKAGDYSVTRVGSQVFYRNDTVETVRFSEGIEQMAPETFYGCGALKTIYLPSTFWGAGIYKDTQYSTNVFTGLGIFPISCTSLSSVVIAKDNPYLTVINGDIYTKDLTYFIFHPNASEATEIVIPSGVRAIDDSACGEDNKNLQKVVLPDTVEYIGYWAFNGCDNLREINIPESCTMIGQFAFYNTEVQDLYIPENMSFQQDIIGSPVNITLNPNNTAYRIQDNWLILNENNQVFHYAKRTMPEMLVVPEGVEVFRMPMGGGYRDACQHVKKLILPQSLKKIGWMEFREFSMLEELVIPANVTELEPNIIATRNALKRIVIYSAQIPLEQLKSAFNCIINDDHTQTIYGVPGSSAEQFAEEEGYTFAAISSYEEEHYVDCSSAGQKNPICISCGKTVSGNYTVIHAYEQKWNQTHCWWECAVCGDTTEPEVHYAKCYRADACANCGRADVTVEIRHGYLSLSYFDSMTHQLLCFDCNEYSYERHATIEGGYFCLICGGSGPENPRIMPALHLPETLTKIESEAFAGISTEVVVIPSTCTSIGSRAFANCTQLLAVYRPESLTDIAEDAFAGCSRVQFWIY